MGESSEEMGNWEEPGRKDKTPEGVQEAEEKLRSSAGAEAQVFQLALSA